MVDTITVHGETIITVVSEGVQGPAGPQGPQGSVEDALAAIRDGVDPARDTLAKMSDELDAAVTALVDTAPGALDTLKELADALGGDPNFATTVLNDLAAKQPLAAPLTQLSAAAPVADDVWQFKSGTWTNRSPAQVVADLMGKSVTADGPVFNVSQTWNGPGVAFTADRVNVTDTASAAGSLLLDRQVGGVSKFRVDKTGMVTAQSAVAGTQGWFVSSISLGSLTGGDTPIVRDSANTPALRNGASPQTLRAYNTFTDGSNYERAVFGWGVTGSVLSIGTEAAGAGAPRNVEFLIGGSRKLDFGLSNSGKWSSGGDMVAPNYYSTTGIFVGPSLVNWGAIVQSSVIGLRSDALLTWYNGANINGASGDLFLGRNGPANLRLGAADSAAPVGQSLSVQSVAAGVLDVAGSSLTINGSVGTGSGAGGPIIFRTAPAGASGAGQNALSPALTLNGDRSASFGGTVTSGNNLVVPGTSDFLFSGRTKLRCPADGSFSILNAAATAYGVLTAEAADNLALANSVNPQSFGIYATRTDTSNYERARHYWNAGVYTIATEKLGTGVARNIRIEAANRLLFKANGLDSWGVEADGTLRPQADNLYSIGSSSNRVVDIWLSGQANSLGGYGKSGSPASQGMAFSGATTRIVANTGGVISFGNAADGAGFGAFQSGAWRIGPADGAAPTAQTITAQGVLAGTANTAGALTTIQGSPSTGNVNGGGIKFQVTPAGGSGTAQNAFADALLIAGNKDLTIYGTLGVNSHHVSAIGTAQFGPNSATILTQDADHVLAQRNGPNAQAKRVFNTYTDVSNGEWFETSWVSNLLTLQTNNNGTGAWRSMKLACAGFMQLAPASGAQLYNGGVSRVTLKWATGGLLQLRNGGDNADAVLQAATTRLATAAKTADYTATDTDRTILVNPDSSAGAGYTVTLPTAVGRTGQEFIIKHIGTAKQVAVAASGGQTIDGAPDLILSTPMQFVTVQSDGANWWAI